MTSPESINSQEPQVSTAETEVEPELEKVFSDRLLDLLDKNPSTKDIAGEFKRSFNEMETVTYKTFSEVIDSARGFERREKIKAFVNLSALEYISLHEELTENLELADLDENEREEIFQTSQETAAFCEGRSLLALYANRNNEKRKGMSSLDKNTENAALQQSLAKYYLRYSDNLDEIEPRLDKYGEKVFGSKEEYESFNRGVVSLTDAYRHIESMGHKAFFPPPEMDAGQAIDLFYIDKNAQEYFDGDMESFFSKNFSMDDLASLDPEVRSHIYGVQVKTRHNLKNTYEDFFENHLSRSEKFEDMLNELSVNNVHVGFNENISEATEFSSNETEGLRKENSLAMMFKRPPVEEVSYSSDGELYEDEDPRKNKIIKDLQEIGSFFCQNSIVGSAYILVEHIYRGRFQKKFY